MDNDKTVTRTTKALAFVCSVCPFCLVKRKWPASTFARVMNRVERGCPFCRAYRRVTSSEDARS